MSLRSLRLPVALLIAVVAVAGCARKHPAPSAPPLTEWPQGHTEAIKITDSLTLQVPLQYWRYAINPVRPPRVPVLPHSDHFEVQFDFFLPDFSGYTLQNYHNDSDENKVEVVYLHAGDMHEAEPGAPGEYPPNMLKRALKELVDPNDYKELYGLRCYKGKILTDRLTCYGRRDDKSGEDILLYVPIPPFAPDVTFPMIQARYFSKRYGGVRVAWRTHVRNLPRWHDIDAQIWRFIDEWNVEEPQPAAPAAAPGQAAPPAPAPGQAVPTPAPGQAAPPVSHPPAAPTPPSPPPPAPSPRSPASR
ncbi:MAG TPA: hypothetical protein VKB72_11075 [Steroidobacteraceae bacterium]|nr:hypothetical protein [Steroidobacteraceae bacterium]